MKNSRLQKIIILLIIDIFSVALAAIATIALIEPVTGLSRYENVLKIYLPCEIVVTIVVYTIMKLYQSLWRYAGIEEFCNIIISIVIISVGNLGFVFLTKNQAYLPIRFAIINPFLLFCMTALSRYVYRLLRYITNRVMHKHNFGPTRVMVVGAGSAGSTIIKELIDSDKVVKKAVCCIDDNHSKQGTRIHGILVVGGRESIIQMAEKYKVDEIIVAMPSVKAKSRAEILNICKETKCRVKVLPGIFELVNGTVSVSKARDVEIIDLLGREQIEINIDEVIRYIENRVVLVTGGGGSIGSELCRQIASHNPKQLIIVDIYENNAYEIEQEIKRNHPELNLLTLIASIRDKGKVNDIFEKYRPEIVFNAAAHKHVPLMETSPNEAIKNNVFGTLNVAKAANQYGTKRFVQISTDKAVNPTNIMGASKRICEMIIQTIGLHSKTCEFVAV